MEEKRFKLKFFAAVFFAVATVSAFWFFISSPLAERAEKFVLDLERSRELLAALNQKEARFAELKNLNSEVESEFPALEQTVLSEKNILEFVVLLEDLARSSKVVLAIDPPASASGRQGESFRILTFRLNVWGGFPNFFQFFRSLENLDFWANIEEVKVAVIDDFSLPVGPRFGGLAANDVSAIIVLNVFLSD